MSHSYHLVCVDCKCVLDLGKFVSMDSDGGPIPWQIAGWRDQESDEWLDDQKLWRLVERFFILHRGHALTVVPEVFIDRADPEGSFTYIDSADQLMREKVSPEPDDDVDAKEVSSCVRSLLITE